MQHEGYPSIFPMPALPPAARPGLALVPAPQAREHEVRLLCGLRRRWSSFPNRRPRPLSSGRPHSAHQPGGTYIQGSSMPSEERREFHLNDTPLTRLQECQFMVEALCKRRDDVATVETFHKVSLRAIAIARSRRSNSSVPSTASCPFNRSHTRATSSWRKRYGISAW